MLDDQDKTNSEYERMLVGRNRQEVKQSSALILNLLSGALLLIGIISPRIAEAQSNCSPPVGTGPTAARCKRCASKSHRLRAVRPYCPSEDPVRYSSACPRALQ